MKCLYYNTLLMTIAGVFKIETDNRIKRIFFNFWRLTVNFSLLFLIISSVKGLRENEFKYAVKNYVYLMAGLAVWSKTTYLVIYDGTSYELVKEMRNLFKYRTDTGLVEKDLGKYINLTNKITLATAIYMSLLGHAFVLASSIINRSSRTFNLPMWCIFNCKISPYYEMMVFLEMFIHQMCAITMISADSLFVSSLILLGAQFRFLGWELKHVLHKTLLKKAVGSDVVLTYASKFPHMQDTPLGKFCNSIEFKTELVKNLNELVEFHGLLVNMCARVNDFFSPAHFMYVGMLLISTVFIEYNLVTSEDLLLRIEYIMYLAALVFSIFIPCYFGNFLTSQTEEFMQELYDSPWYICDKNFQTNFKILQQRAGKPFRFTFGKFGILSLSTFVGFMRAGMSYLAVLRQITKDS